MNHLENKKNNQEKYQLEWNKFDIHIHTHKTAWDKNNVNIDENNIDDFKKKLIENKIKLIVPTNHNEINLEHFKLLKEKLEPEIKVLYGVELSFYIDDDDKGVRIRFDANLIINENSKDFEKIIDFINKIFKEKLSRKERKEKSNEFYNFLKDFAKHEGEYILILDYNKSSTDRKNQTKRGVKTISQNDFFFTFDFFEGNKSTEIFKIRNFFEKIPHDALKKTDINGINCVFGTDNRNYQIYPDNQRRKEWTDTYFLTEPSFHGLKLASYFDHFVRFNAKEIPKMREIAIKELKYKYDEKDLNEKEQIIYFERGVNVLIGKRASGKTKLLKKIQTKLKDSQYNFEKIEQQEIQKLVDALKFEETLYKTDYGEKTLKDFKKEIENEYFVIDFFHYEEKQSSIDECINNLGNNVRDIMESEILKIESKIEDYISNQISLALKITKTDNLINTLLKNLNDFFIFVQKTPYSFRERIQEAFDFKKFKKGILEEVRKKLFINIENDYKHYMIPSLNPDLTYQKTESENNNFIEKYKKNINDKILIVEEIKKIRNQTQRWKLIFSKFNKFKTEIEIKNPLFLFDNKNSLFSDFNDFLDRLGKSNKRGNFKNFLKDWKNKEILQNLSKKVTINFIDNDDFVKIITFLNNKEIDKMSPGEIVNEFIKTKINETDSKNFIMDQPEDQLDAESVLETIIQPIMNRYPNYIDEGHQFFFVTHDPKLAVNIGATNIIVCSVEKEKFYKKKNVYLTKEKDLEKIIKYVDGKRSIVHKRGDIYGRKERKN